MFSLPGFKCQVPPKLSPRRKQWVSIGSRFSRVLGFRVGFFLQGENNGSKFSSYNKVQWK